MRELPLALPRCLWGIEHSSLQKRQQVRSARVTRHTVFDNLAPLAEHSADILVPHCPQTPAPCGFFRSHLLVFCTAKPRYTAAAAREHRRVLASRLPTPGASVTSPLHTPREVLFEMCQRRVHWPLSKARCARCSFANGSPPSKAAWSHFAASRTRSFGHADADERLCGPGAWSAPVAVPWRAARTQRVRATPILSAAFHFMCAKLKDIARHVVLCGKRRL